MEIIDSHQHYWQVARGDYSWMGPHVAQLLRDFLPHDLAAHRAAAGVSRTVAVQAAPTVAETEFLLDLAEADDSIAAVVGWVDVASSDAGVTLERLAKRSKLRGIRPMLQDIEDTFHILRPECMATLARLPQLGLTLDALVQPRHLAIVAALADRLPTLGIVVDHGAKPFISKGILEPWASDMTALARRQNVFCKLSGLVTEVGGHWSAGMLKPYAELILEIFGAERVMFGSDWPVLELAASYQDWWQAAHQLTAHCSPDQRAAIFGGTAKRFYRL